MRRTKHAGITMKPILEFGGSKKQRPFPERCRCVFDGEVEKTTDRKCTGCGERFMTRKTRREVYCRKCREKLHGELVKKFICRRKHRG